MPKSPSRFIWYELITSDVTASAAFYGAVLGWTEQSAGQAGMDYRIWMNDGTGIGGLMTTPAEAAANGMRPAWLGYAAVANVDDAVAAIVAARGSVCMPAMDIPGVGRIAMVLDPQGAAIYVMTPIGDGPSLSFAPGKPGHCGWNELYTTDWPAAFAFYHDQFGWEKAEAIDMGPMGTYQLFHAGDGAIGGMMNNQAVPRPAWMFYFNAAEITAADDRVRAAGGEVLHGPMQVPGGQWIIQARDPLGAAFGLVAPVAS